MRKAFFWFKIETLSKHHHQPKLKAASRELQAGWKKFQAQICLLRER